MHLTHVQRLLSRITPILLTEVYKLPVSVEDADSMGEVLLDSLLLFAYGALTGLGVSQEEFKARVASAVERIIDRIATERAAE